MKRILFLCGKNRMRSPTAEQVFSGHPGIECSSAGLSSDADNPLTPELLQWADIIVVMEKSHRSRLAKKYKRYLSGQRVVCLDIPDVYEFMAPELVALLHSKSSRFLPLGIAGRKP